MDLVKVEVERIAKQGMTNSKSPKPYFIMDCYVHDASVKHPQACQLFSDVAHNPGMYNVPRSLVIDNKRPSWALELSAAQVIPARAAS